MICSCVRADTILTVSKSPYFYGECGPPPHPTHLTRCWFAQYFRRFLKTMSTSSTSTFLLCPKLVCTGMFHMLLTPYNPLKFWMTHVFSKNSAYYIVSTQKMFQNNWVCRNNTQWYRKLIFGDWKREDTSEKGLWEIARAIMKLIQRRGQDFPNLLPLLWPERELSLHLY